jgi:8-oxo-dGTP diphosphatase
MSAPRHSVSVAAVVVDDRGRALVIRRRDTGAWQLPGGVLELDEQIPDGVRREVREETGLDVAVGPLTGVYKNMTLGVVALVFRARHTGGEPRLTDESAAVEWWTGKAVAAAMDEAFAVRILDALADRTTPAVRAHDGVTLLG